jgi:predicted RNase H-like HicB family nuclease
LLVGNAIRYICDLKPTLAEKPMPPGLILVKAAYDADAAVWFVESCDLEGVNAEAPSLEELLQKLPGVILDLLEEAGFDDAEVPVEVIAHASTRVRRGTAA